MNKRVCTFGAAFGAAHLLAASCAMANNIQVSSVTLQSINTTAGTAMVQFNLTWENSWRVATGPANHDAAWVFVKYHTGDLIWKTATLDVSDAQHSVPAAATLDMGVNGTRGMGAFIYRSGFGSGNNAFNSIRLKWNFGADAVASSALVTLDVHAIEMVYIPQGPFFVGDGVARAGTGDTATLVAGPVPPGTDPYQIVNGGPTNVGPVAGSLSYTAQGAGSYKQMPTTFPNGFDPYYVMKYEGSQGQWAAFLNATSKFPPLAYLHYEVLVPGVLPPPGGVPVSRDTLNGRQVFFSDDLPPPTVLPGPIGPPPLAPVPPVPTRPVVKAKFPDRGFIATEITSLAYLDWSGLRPLSEFEYEKAARGPLTPVAGEYAWGTADIAVLSYGVGAPGATTLAFDGLPNEAPALNYNETGGNAWYRATQLTLPVPGTPPSLILGPARVGMFAKPAYNPPTPPRIQSGAGYYGVMDLTGNLSELVAKWGFPLSTSTVALFTGEHGDGALGTNGQHNVAGWFTTAPPAPTFFGLRGGSFNDAATPVSFRATLTGTLTNPGIRGVRSAPALTP